MKFNKHGVAKTFKFESLSDRRAYAYSWWLENKVQ